MPRFLTLNPCALLLLYLELLLLPHPGRAVRGWWEA